MAFSGTGAGAEGGGAGAEIEGGGTGAEIEGGTEAGAEGGTGAGTKSCLNAKDDCLAKVNGFRLGLGTGVNPADVSGPWNVLKVVNFISGLIANNGDLSTKLLISGVIIYFSNVQKYFLRKREEKLERTSFFLDFV